jgi:formiminotetrahydrofolate cyclodeaminase
MSWASDTLIGLFETIVLDLWVFRKSHYVGKRKEKFYPFLVELSQALEDTAENMYSDFFPKQISSFAANVSTSLSTLVDKLADQKSGLEQDKLFLKQIIKINGSIKRFTNACEQEIQQKQKLIHAQEQSNETIKEKKKKEMEKHAPKNSQPNFSSTNEVAINITHGCIGYEEIKRYIWELRQEDNHINWFHYVKNGTFFKRAVKHSPVLTFFGVNLTFSGMVMTGMNLLNQYAFSHFADESLQESEHDIIKNYIEAATVSTLGFGMLCISVWKNLPTLEKVEAAKDHKTTMTLKQQEDEESSQLLRFG